MGGAPRIAAPLPLGRQGKGPVLEAGGGAGHYPSTSDAAPQTRAFTGSSRTRCGANSCSEHSRLIQLQYSSASQPAVLELSPPCPSSPTSICLLCFRSWVLPGPACPAMPVGCTLRRGARRSCPMQGHSRQGVPPSRASPEQHAPLRAEGYLAAGLGEQQDRGREGAFFLK